MKNENKICNLFGYYLRGVCMCVGEGLLKDTSEITLASLNDSNE